MEFQPLLARNRSLRRAVAPVAYDCVKVIVIRAGSAILSGDLSDAVRAGDVLFLGANTMCGSAPDALIRTTTVYLDTDYATDMLFWQHVGQVKDRFEAARILASVCARPWTIVRLDETAILSVGASLDELVALSESGQFVDNYYRILGLWYSLVSLIAPTITSHAAWAPSTQVAAHARAALPRARRFAPVRAEARTVAEVLVSEMARAWTLKELSGMVHLSPSQLVRMSTTAYGKTPRAYQTMVRCEELARLLRETDLSVEAAERLVGWAHRRSAARMFRSLIGITPSAYRREHRPRQLDAI